MNVDHEAVRQAVAQWWDLDTDVEVCVTIADGVALRSPLPTDEDGVTMPWRLTTTFTLGSMSYSIDTALPEQQVTHEDILDLTVRQNRHKLKVHAMANITGYYNEA